MLGSACQFRGVPEQRSCPWRDRNLTVHRVLAVRMSSSKVQNLTTPVFLWLIFLVVCFCASQKRPGSRAGGVDSLASFRLSHDGDVGHDAVTGSSLISSLSLRTHVVVGDWGRLRQLSSLPVLPNWVYPGSSVNPLLRVGHSCRGSPFGMRPTGGSVAHTCLATVYS